MAYTLAAILAFTTVMLGVAGFLALSRLQRLERAGREMLESMTQFDLTRLEWERKPKHLSARLAMVRALSGLRDTR